MTTRSIVLQVTEAEAAALLEQLSAIDVSLVNELFRETMAAASGSAAPVSSTLEPPQDVTSLASAPAEDKAAWYKAGLAAIAAGKAAVLILAGGQGTRLGFDRPKGEYNIGLPSGKTLFKMQAERVRRLKALAAPLNGGVEPSLPLYIMTSPMTDTDTRAFFSAHSNFGLPAADVTFFSQGTLPCMDFQGKIMLENGGKVAQAPDGNGGIYRAMHLQGIVADLQRRGVVGTHVFAVDNAVVKAGDPTFLGFCMGKNADVGSKACPKTGPHEKVGVLCRRGGQYTVVEYSELDKASAELVDPATGALTYNAGNICIHYYSTAFLADKCSPAALPKVYHVAKKSIPYAHPDTGKTLTKAELAPLGNTGVKLESFIFDVFPASNAMAVLEIVREEEFSPVKNAPGSNEDSPDTARALMCALHTQWLKAAGAVLVGAGDGAVEVSPLASYQGEGLQVLAGQELAAPLLVQLASEPLPTAKDGAAPGPETPVVAGAVSKVVIGGLTVYCIQSAQ